VSQLGRGRIVWVELLDPQSRNAKCRPAVIVTPDADIREDGDVWVVAISTQLDEAPVEAQVELPWERRGHPRTGLKERCAAVCTWMEKVRVSSIQGYAGTVPGRQLLEILTRIKPPDLPAESSVSE
jgi:mRNA-degrading endonuclease toxin of MazEF toxin-antitoxin module